MKNNQNTTINTNNNDNIKPIVPIISYANADTKKSAIMINNLQNLTLNPNFVTGFSDAECSFTISLVRTKKGKVG